MTGNSNSGRKPKECAVRTSILIDAEIYNYLSRHGNVSAEVERIAREDMGNPEATNIVITRRSKLGWGYTSWTPEHPEPPSRPDYVGTYRSVDEEIQSDRTYRSFVSGGTYHTTCWFARVNGAWRRIVDGEPADLRHLEQVEVTVE